MRFAKTFMSVIAGLLSVAALAVTAHAQTTVMNVGGSSAARNFMGTTPLNLCDASPLPNLYVSANNNLWSWTCNQGGLPIQINYAATQSSDGINTLLVATGSAGSFLNFLDITQTTGCTGPVTQTRASDGKQYNQTSNCANSNTVSLPVHMGASDVAGSSFGQTGPLGTTQPVIDDSSLTVATTAVFPWSIFLGKGVVKVSGGAPAGPITNLTRLELEAIFSREAKAQDWTQLGYGTTANGTTLETTSPIVLCLRNAGSGSKAMLAQTIMINAKETVLANSNVIFSSGTSGVLSCIASNPRSIGYMDADQELSFLSGGANAGLGYAVKVDGYLAHDASLTNPKENLECGRYAYWTYERLNRRGTSEGAAIDALAAAFIADATSASTIALLPVGSYWDAQSKMNVFKNVDRGPLTLSPLSVPSTACN